jgi:hypothetical protein
MFQLGFVPRHDCGALAICGKIKGYIIFGTPCIYHSHNDKLHSVGCRPEITIGLLPVSVPVPVPECQCQVLNRPLLDAYIYISYEQGFQYFNIFQSLVMHWTLIQ